MSTFLDKNISFCIISIDKKSNFFAMEYEIFVELKKEEKK